MSNEVQQLRLISRILQVDVADLLVDSDRVPASSHLYVVESGE